ncbi:uncharacterized protein VTP21DRAFT_708 [Calcarisporiella thermophila]|uniref:uncharacterized protein n=1 Tax=Calcarisporiella thermophila TaxID=911321 RepID=UPI003742CE7F
MSEGNTSLAIEHIRNQCKNIVRESREASRLYYECLTTNKYGQEYLDPEKCEANNFDPIKASNEEAMRIRLVAKYCSDISNMLDWREADKVIASLAPKNHKKHHTGRPSEASHIPKQAQMRVEKRPRNKIISSVSKAAQRIIPKKLQKQELLSLLSEAAQLVGSEVSIGDTYVKVIAVKMTENSVTLEVNEEVEEGVWDQYEIEYDSNMKPR